MAIFCMALAEFERFEFLAATGEELAEELVVLESHGLDGGDDAFKDDGDEIADDEDEQSRNAAAGCAADDLVRQHERRH